MITAYHVVLVDVVDNAHPVKEKTTEEWSDAAPILNANTQLETPIQFREAV